MTNSVPEKLGKYRIIKEVGRGGFAAVYKAVDTTLNRTVALKVLAPHLLWDPTFVERFQREAEVSANLDHPNIVTIYEVGQIEGVYFIAMQFLEGRTLSWILRAGGPLPISGVQAIIEQLASALDYAHARGFVHRDIKPSNVIVADNGRATLTDFGLVKAGEGTQLTASGVVFGTPEYMSPEQAEGKELDARSDVYSLGVVLYEMLAGRAPFMADTTPAVMYKHVHEPPPLEDLPSDLPQGVVAVVEKALAKKREERYQRVGEIATSLKQAVGEIVVEEIKAPAPPQPVTPSDEAFPTVRGPESVVVTPLWLVGPEGQGYELKPGSLTLGRAKSCDIHVNDSQVSRHHATLEFDGQKCTIYDEGSANGTFVNEQRVGAEGLPFRVGDRLKVGATDFSLSATVSPRPLVRKEERPAVDEWAATAGVPPLAAPPVVEPVAVVREESKPPTPKAAPKRALGGVALLAGGLVLLCIVGIIGLAIVWPPWPTPTPPVVVETVEVVKVTTVPPPTDTQTPTPMLAKETPTTPPAPTATPTETPVIPSPEAVYEIGYLGINRGRKPLDDVRVRQAVAHAIDKWYIVGTLYPPTAEVATQFIPPGIFGHTEGQEYHDYDPDKAKQLLAEAGYPDGFKTTLWVMPVSRGYYPTPDEIGEVMKSQLAAVGIEADTLILDWALYREKVPAGEADLFMLGWTFDSNDGTHLLDNLFGMGADQRFGPHFPELEQMLAQGASTVGAAERQSIYDKVNQFIYENAIVVPIVHP